MYLEEEWDAEELKLHSGLALVQTRLWEAVLQNRRQRDESHRAIEGVAVDENLEHKERFMLEADTLYFTCSRVFVDIMQTRVFRCMDVHYTAKSIHPPIQIIKSRCSNHFHGHSGV